MPGSCKEHQERHLQNQGLEGRLFQQALRSQNSSAVSFTTDCSVVVADLLSPSSVDSLAMQGTGSTAC